LVQLGRFLAYLGRNAEAYRVIEELEGWRDRHYVSRISIAFIRGALGDQEALFQALEEALEQRSAYLCFIGVDPVFDRFRREPRFQALLKRMGLEVESPAISERPHTLAVG
jgi:hypothetical protein